MNLEQTQAEKTRTPQQKRSIETRNQIIRASMKLFSAKGYHNTNTKEIAAEAGVATGCFYSYFTDKRAVFLEALKYYKHECNIVLQDHLQKLADFKGCKRDYVRSLIISLIDVHQIFTGFHNELIIMKYSDPEVRAILDEELAESLQNTLTYIRHWQDEIKVQDIEAAAHVIFDSVHKVVDSITFSKQEIEAERLIDATIEMILKYLFY